MPRKLVLIEIELTLDRDFYFGQPRWVKVLVAIAILLISFICWLLGYFVPAGWAIGFVFLLAAFIIEDD